MQCRWARSKPANDKFNFQANQLVPLLLEAGNVFFVILPNKSRFITKLLRGGGKQAAMDRRMDSFAHGDYDGLDGGDRDASAGK